MSFSKARIQRFNELTSEAPPPGSYDPKFDSKVKSFVIEKTERFQDSKSVTSSGAECNMSVSSKGTGPVPSPKFRTPQLPKKRVIAKPTNMSCPKAKTKLVLGSSKDLKYDVRDELADLKVECANKDKTIQDHARQIDEMKRETWKLEKELADLHAKQAEIEDQHKKDLESMASLQQEIQDSRDQKHHAEVELLRSQLLEMTEARAQEMLAQKAMQDRIEQRLFTISKKSAMLEEEMRQMEITQMDAQSELARMKDKLAEVKNGKEEEIRELSSIVAQKESELSAVQTELNQLKSVSDEMRDLLSRLEDERESEIVFLKNEEETLRAEVAELSKVRSDLESKLETRQQVVLQLQSQLSTLQCEVDELRAESETKTRELMDRHDRELIDMRHEFIRERESLQNDKQREIARRLELECENKEQSETNAFLTEELQDVQQLYKDTNRRLLETQEALETVNQKYSEALSSHREEIEAVKIHHSSEMSELQELLEMTRLEYLRELDNMTEARNNELVAVKAEAERTIEEERRRMKERTDKIVENAEAVTRETLAACRAESEDRVKRVIAESDANERHAADLARVEAEKALLEEKLAQRDDEIVKLSVTLDDLKIVVENQESFSQSLQLDLDRVEAELAERKDELRALKDQIRSEAAEMVARRRRFEVVMAENQASVAALSQRLYESDAEVERLQNELKTGEDSIHEHRGLLSAMRNTSKILSEELYTLMEQLDENKGRFDQLEAGNLAEIENLRSLFYTEIESLKHISAKEMKRLEEQCTKKDEQNAELKNHLDAMVGKLSEARDVLLKFEELEDTRAIEISQLQLQKEKLVQELKLKTKAVEETKILLEAREAECKLAKDEKLRLEREQQENRLKEEISSRRAEEDVLLKLEELEDARAVEISQLQLQKEKLVQELKLKSEAVEETKILLEAREAESKLAKDEADQQIALLTARIAVLEEKNSDVEKLRLERDQQENRLKEEISRRRAAEEVVKQLSDDCEGLRKSYQEVSDKYAEMIGHHNHKQRVKHLNQLKDKILRLEKDVETKKHTIDQQTKTIEKLKTEDKRSFAKGKENLHSHGISRSPYTTPASSPLKPLTPLRERNE